MSWNLLDNITSSGNAQADLVNTLIAPAANYGAFWAILILLPLFVILATKTYFKEKERIGHGEILGSMAVASFVTILTGLLMNLIGLIGNEVFSWIVGLGILVIVIFLFLKD